MKKIFFISLLLFWVTLTFAQEPKNFQHQLIVRDGAGMQINNTNVGVQLSILQGSTSGTPVFVETYSLTTNASALLSISVGTGIAT